MSAEIAAAIDRLRADLQPLIKAQTAEAEAQAMPRLSVRLDECGPECDKTMVLDWLCTAGPMPHERLAERLVRAFVMEPREL